MAVLTMRMIAFRDGAISDGYSGGDEGEAEARAEQPSVSLAVTMNGVTLPMDGDTVVEHNGLAHFWEVNSYHCTGILEKLR